MDKVNNAYKSLVFMYNKGKDTLMPKWGVQPKDP